jgi:hypothetical protein
MIYKSFIATLSVFLTAGCLLADFSYQQETRITGGAMAAMMKMAGAFSKQARQPMGGTIAVKGNRMFHQTGNGAQIIDLDKETITEIDFEKKTWSQITFAQMAEAIERAMKKLNQDGAPEMKMSATVKETGQSKLIRGVDTKQVILSMEMAATDKKSGQEGGMMMVANMWLATTISGYEEVTAFYQRMGQKLAWSPGAGMMGMGRPDMAKGFADLYKESSKLAGVPVLQVTTMRPKLDPETEKQLAEAMAQQQAAVEQSPPAPAEQRPGAGAAAGEASSGAIAGRLGRLGGFGGFGRRKKQAEAPPQPQAPQAAASGSPAAPEALMEMTTETSNFSNAAVDGARFEVPAGFKQVESQTLKGMR